MGNGEAKELVCMTHGHEARGCCWRELGYRVEGDQGGKMGEKVQGIRSINGRYEIDKGRLRIEWEMEKPKNLYVRHMDMN